MAICFVGKELHATNAAYNFEHVLHSVYVVIVEHFLSCLLLVVEDALQLLVLWELVQNRFDVNFFALVRIVVLNQSEPQRVNLLFIWLEILDLREQFGILRTIFVLLSF